MNPDYVRKVTLKFANSEELVIHPDEIVSFRHCGAECHLFRGKSGKLCCREKRPVYEFQVHRHLKDAIKEKLAPSPIRWFSWEGEENTIIQINVEDVHGEDHFFVGSSGLVHAPIVVTEEGGCIVLRQDSL